MYQVTRAYRVSVYDNGLLDWLRANDMTIVPLLDKCTRLVDEGIRGDGPGLYLVEKTRYEEDRAILVHKWVLKADLEDGERLYGPVRWRAREGETYAR